MEFFKRPRGSEVERRADDAMADPDELDPFDRLHRLYFTSEALALRSSLDRVANRTLGGRRRNRRLGADDHPLDRAGLPADRSAGLGEAFPSP